MNTAALLLVLLLKGFSHETQIHVWQVQPQTFHQHCQPHTQVQHDGRIGSHAGRNSPLSDAVLLPASRLEVTHNDEERQAQSGLLPVCGLP